MHKFLVVIEKGSNGYGAYSPDLPGCVAVGATSAETEQKMYEAISFHVEGLALEGLPIPHSRSTAEYIAIPNLSAQRPSIKRRATAVGVAEPRKKYS